MPSEKLLILDRALSCLLLIAGVLLFSFSPTGDPRWMVVSLGISMIVLTTIKITVANYIMRSGPRSSGVGVPGRREGRQLDE